MQYWFINLLSGFLISAFMSGILIPQVLLIAFRKKLFDEVDERKIHRLPIPRLGGLVFTPIILFVLALLLCFNLWLGYYGILSDLSYNVGVFGAAMCGIILLYLVGIADDLVGVRYRAKFIVQIISGIGLVMSGVWFRNFYGFLGIEGLNEALGGVLAVVLVVFIINAINMIDGLDGLASGLSAVACLYYGITFWGIHLYSYALLAFITLGVIVPFFCYNVFGDAAKQQKIFMGDTGSLTIGFILSLLSIKIVTIPASGIVWSYHPLVVAFSPLMIPCLDVIRVFFHRLRIGKNTFMPDNNHIHHKLLALGFESRATMVIIVVGSLLLSLFNLYISKYIDVHILLLLDFVFYWGLNYFLTRKICK
ncbi:MAG: undecaprenyl/decaprenyl-phosphate alpha-N-acetylglucosaminyl 1-phosphate transferase [Paludibacteraceae bacterium]|nr:undecaprenyl/decaprenyl-phosphate alpha-N-acetylglucosaminyl 1-phosphate transferase [Paludibacteraceae bacterium]